MVAVEVSRVDFTIEPSQFVSWIDVGDEDGGKGEDRQATALDGLRQGAGRLINSVNQGGQAVGGQLYAQMKRLTDDLSAPPPPPYCCPYPYRYCTLTPSLPSRSDRVQKIEVVQSLQSRASMVRHAAASAALPVLKNMQREGELPDPAPRDWVVRLYTCPDRYVIMPPAAPPADPAAAPPEALLIDRASCAARAAPVAEAEALCAGRAKVEVLGVLGIAALEHASYLVLCTGRAFVGATKHGAVYRVTATECRALGAAARNANPIQMSHRAIGPPPSPLVLSGHAASLTPY